MTKYHVPNEPMTGIKFPKGANKFKGGLKEVGVPHSKRHGWQALALSDAFTAIRYETKGERVKVIPVKAQAQKFHRVCDFNKNPLTFIGNPANSSQVVNLLTAWLMCVAYHNYEKGKILQPQWVRLSGTRAGDRETKLLDERSHLDNISTANDLQAGFLVIDGCNAEQPNRLSRTLDLIEKYRGEIPVVAVFNSCSNIKKQEKETIKAKPGLVFQCQAHLPKEIIQL